MAKKNDKEASSTMDKVSAPPDIKMNAFSTSDKWQPIECASRSLTKTEKRYSQLEKEALAIRWACERCNICVIGSSFVIETDRKPLIPLFNNPNSRPPLRIERLLLFLQQFDFTLRYCSGKENAADYLSRHAIPVTTDEERTCGH